jgi:recombination protein RecT
MATQIARQPTSFELELAVYEPQFAAALPSNIKPAMFRRVLITAVNQKPELLEADRRSLFVSCVKCAQDGLLPDGREAALVVYNTKNQDTGQWVPVVQYQPMYQGIAKRARNTGLVGKLGAHLVYSLDAFSYTLGDDERIEHKPAIGNRGDVIGAYSIITLTDGEKVRDFMNTAEINAVRARSRAKDKGPWTTDWGEMARKTVFRRCAKWAPMSADIVELLHRDDDLYEPEAPQVLTPAPKAVSKLERFEQPDPTPRADAAPPAGDAGASEGTAAGQEPAAASEQASYDAETGGVREFFVAVEVKDGASDWASWCATMRDMFNGAHSEGELEQIKRENGAALEALAVGGKGGRKAADSLASIYNARLLALRQQEAQNSTAGA